MATRWRPASMARTSHARTGTCWRASLSWRWFFGPCWVGSGFTGFFSDFRGVFIYLAIAAVAARIRWKGTVAFGAAVGSVALVALALFWTSVKGEYRTYAAGSDESQGIVVPLSERLGYLGTRAITPGVVSLGDSSYMLLSRLAYVDIFGSVIDVQEAAPEQIPMRQWMEA